MTFATLEERFNATSNTLYKRYENTEQLEVILPDSRDSRSRIKNDTRAVPVVSTARDLKLMGKYLKSFEKGGPQFLATQQFLQTGNTFAETRLYNPLGVLIHTVPFVHKPRNLPLSPLRNKRGALQQETINKISEGQGSLLGRFLSGAVNAAVSPFKALTTSPRNVFNSKFYERPEDLWFGSSFPRLAEVQSVESRGDKKLVTFYNTLSNRDFGHYLDNAIVSGRRGIVQKNTDSRDGINRTTTYFLDDRPRGTTVIPPAPQSGSYLSLMGNVEAQRKNTIFNLKNSRYEKTYTIGAVPNDVYMLSAEILPNPVTGDTQRFNEIKAEYGNSVITPYTASLTFKSLEAKLNSNGYFQTTLAGYTLLEPTSIETITRQTGSIVDPYNTPLTAAIAQGATSTQGIRSTSYLSISGEKQEKSDIIKFIFKAVDNSEPIHFRALISNINENVKPEYNETKYVGRTERFVTYAGAKRTVSLDFNIVAFSLNELDQMWTRINYLTGLAFPRGVSTSGFMVPPLFRLTIGGIYDSQPCYVESLDFTMLDESITFDIDKEVSQTIAVSMTISLLEKRSRFYDSPFYNIVEKLQVEQQNAPRPTR
jgi:hypothetical protein